MSIGLISALIGIALVASIAIAFVKKINAGILALACAIIIAILTGTKFGNVLGGFPTKVVMAMFALTFFFGFFTENGTVEWISNKLMRLSSKIPAAVPYIFFFTALLLGATGGPNTLIFVVTMAVPIGLACGMPLWEIGSICVMGANCGSYCPISQHGTTARSLIEAADEGVWVDSAMTINWYIFFIAVIAYLIIITIYYFVAKNYKIKKVEAEVKDVKLNKDQKFCMVLLVCMIILMIAPFLLNKIFPTNAVIKYILNYADITLLATLGVSILGLTGKGDFSDILKKRVPWNTIVLIFGMGMLVDLAAQLGVLEYITGFLKDMPTWLFVPSFCLFAGVMSLFSSSLSVVYPTLIPIASALCLANDAINPVAIFAAIVIGAATAAMSPMSMSGALVMAGAEAAPDVNKPSSDKQFRALLIIALVTLAILTVLSAVGVFGIFKL